MSKDNMLLGCRVELHYKNSNTDKMVRYTGFISHISDSQSKVWILDPKDGRIEWFPAASASWNIHPEDIKILEAYSRNLVLSKKTLITETKTTRFEMMDLDK